MTSGVAPPPHCGEQMGARGPPLAGVVMEDGPRGTSWFPKQRSRPVQAPTPLTQPLSKHEGRATLQTAVGRQMWRGCVSLSAATAPVTSARLPGRCANNKVRANAPQ